MKTRFLRSVLLVAATFAVAVLVAGCGGGGSSAAELNPEDVASVGDQHITKAQLAALMQEAKVNLTAQGQAFPKAGTTAYAALRAQAVTLLVREAEKAAAAADLGIVVTDKDIQKKLDEIKKQYFSSSEAKYKASLKKQGLTDEEVRNNIKSQLISQKLVNKLTKDVTVTPTAVLAYYSKNLSQYKSPQSRAVRYILLGKNKGPLTETVRKQLDGATDATWCTLVKRYTQDSGSKATCGKHTFNKGETVPEFDKLAFTLPTNKVTKLNTSQYGWFILQPLAAVKAASTTPIKDVEAQIKKGLVDEKKNALITEWQAKLEKTNCKDGTIKYQAGYKPSPDPCATTSTTTTTN
jgi:foldase protein PrsA